MLSSLVNSLRFFSLAAMAFLPVLTPGWSADFYVNLSGSDSNNGLSSESAFRSIQKGLDALKAGDTLHIGPGEYREAVSRSDLGNDQVDTIIRAEIPGTVLLRGDLPVANFERDPNYQFVWITSFPMDVQAVNELDSLSILKRAPTVEELEWTPGRFFYDSKSGKLYLSTTDMREPQVHSYTVSTMNRTGFYLERPQRVVIQGLAATGFNTHTGIRGPTGAVWGFWIQNGTRCRIEQCVAFLNGSGIGTWSRRLGKGMLGGMVEGEAHGGQNIISQCRAFANYSEFDTEGGNIVCYQPNSDQILDSVSFWTLNKGIRLYGTHYGQSQIARSLAWGSLRTDLFVKGVNTHLGSINQSIGAAHIAAVLVNDSLIGMRNRYRNKGGQPEVNTIKFYEEADLDLRKEFADEEHFDYRLQKGSRFIGTGENGKDRGPHPYQENIFYVRPDGNDASDGLSITSAWKNLDQAIHRLRGGDTLYVEGGLYTVSGQMTPQGKKDQPISIRGRGRQPAVVQGKLDIVDGQFLTVERITFRDTVKIVGGEQIDLSRCVFATEESFGFMAENVAGLRVTHGLFTGFTEAGIRLTGLNSDVFLSSNLYQNVQGFGVLLEQDSVRYSDYNGYHNPGKAWKTEGKVLSLAELGQIGIERYAQNPRVQLAPWEGSIRVIQGSLVGGRLGYPLGPYNERDMVRRQFRMTKPTVHSVGKTTANIEWKASLSATYEIGWGKSPDCENTRIIDSDFFTSVSLENLDPGEKYYFKIRKVTPASFYDFAGGAEMVIEEKETIELVTRTTERTPQKWYVTKTGNNAHSGSSEEEAFATISHAAGKAGPGDVVLVGEGEYQETVRIRNTGTKEAPVLFRPLQHQRVTLNGSRRNLATAFSVLDKAHIQFDGFYFRDFNYHWTPVGWLFGTGQGIFNLYQSDHILITRCFSDGRGPFSPATFLKSRECGEITMNNCVVLSGWNAIIIERTARCIIENSVLVVPFIVAVSFNELGSPNDRLILRNNVITDNKASKTRVWILEMAGTSVLQEENNCYVLRIPDSEKKPLNCWRDGEPPLRVGIADYYSVIGKPSGNSIFENPRFAGLKDAGDGETFVGDAILQKGNDFSDFFATNLLLIERNIGLQPEKFAKPE